MVFWIICYLSLSINCGLMLYTFQNFGLLYFIFRLLVYSVLALRIYIYYITIYVWFDYFYVSELPITWIIYIISHLIWIISTLDYLLSVLCNCHICGLYVVCGLFVRLHGLLFWIILSITGLIRIPWLWLVQTLIWHSVPLWFWIKNHQVVVGVVCI